MKKLLEVWEGLKKKSLALAVLLFISEIIGLFSLLIDGFKRVLNVIPSIESSTIWSDYWTERRQNIFFIKVAIYTVVQVYNYLRKPTEPPVDKPMDSLD